MIASITHSPYTTKIPRIRCYAMLSTIFKCQDVQHAISAYINSLDEKAYKCVILRRVREETGWWGLRGEAMQSQVSFEEIAEAGDDIGRELVPKQIKHISGIQPATSLHHIDVGLAA